MESERVRENRRHRGEREREREGDRLRDREGRELQSSCLSDWSISILSHHLEWT